MLCKIIFVTVFVGYGSCFWDTGTTTFREERVDTVARTSFFRWQWTESVYMKWIFWGYDWDTIERNFRLARVAGISIDMQPLSTGALLNRRSLITAYNFLNPYMNRQREMRVWALGRAGLHNTPYRYRVYSVHRLVPLSMNTEHCHGPRCTHQPRHDVCIMVTQDQIYLYSGMSRRYLYATRGTVVHKTYHVYFYDLWMAGSGYEYLQHVYENYKIFWWKFGGVIDLVDCSKYTVKHWGKFICLKNVMSFPGVQNGGPLFSGPENILGLGCFEIRFNDDRIFVFTDLRFYRTKIDHYAYLWPGQYYEYAYPQWSAHLGFFYDGHWTNKGIPSWKMKNDIYPLGKK